MIKENDFTSEEIEEIRAGLKDIRNGDAVSEDDAGEQGLIIQFQIEIKN